MEKELYLEFTNEGEIDVNALRLLGASTKETDASKIGFWGTGLKYAIAVLLREDVAVKVFSGKKEIKIGKRKTKMRNETFEVMTVNGTPTSVTTRMGKDWELWYAVRELYANMKDEGRDTIGVKDKAEGKAGETRIFVEFSAELKDVFDNLPKYFCFSREVKYEFALDKVFTRYSKKKGIIYRRGFAVGSMENMLFDYDLHDININETRTIKSSYNLPQHLGLALRRYAPLEVIRRLVNTACYERDELDYDWSDGAGFCDSWLNALRGMVIIPREATGFYVDDMSEAHLILPSGLCKALNKFYGDSLIIRGFSNGKEKIMQKIEISEVERQAIDSVITKMVKVFPDVGNINLYVAKMKSNILGTVDKGGIVLNQNLFNMGEHELMKTIIEEYIHIKSGATDRTREFQDYATHCIATAIQRVSK